MATAPGKMDFRELDADTQQAVLRNSSLPVYEQMVTAAAASADQEMLTQLTEEYNRARGLPVAVDTTGTTVPTDSNTIDSTADDDKPDAAETYEGDRWQRDDLKDEAMSRGLDVTGTGADGYVTKDDYRKALIEDDNRVPETYTGEHWDRDALEAEANRRELEVTGTGKNGYITKANYRDALIADDNSEETTS